MSEISKIEWTDSTFNPWEGCTKVGPGCDHCYAEARNNRFQGGNWGPGAPRRRTSARYWRLPLKWNDTPLFQCPECGWRGIEKESGMWMIEESGRAADDGESPSCPRCEDKAIIALQPARRRVFCASLADWLDNEVPIEWLIDLLDLIRQTPNLDWQLLTKRVGIWRPRLELAALCLRKDLSRDDSMLATLEWLHDWLHGDAPKNVWLGATIVNQEEADRDIPKLLQVPAAVRFLSMEPLLGPVDLTNLVMRLNPDTEDHFSCLGCDVPPEDDLWSGACVNWVIVGGESGPHARPMHREWVRSLRDQCQAAAIPFLLKQWGEWASPGYQPRPPIQDYYYWPYDRQDHARIGQQISYRIGKRRAGRHLDGRTWNQFPEAP